MAIDEFAGNSWLRGKGAIHAAQAHGAPLYRLTADARWEVCEPGELGRIARAEQVYGADAYVTHYGAKASDVSATEHCAACWNMVIASIR